MSRVQSGTKVSLLGSRKNSRTADEYHCLGDVCIMVKVPSTLTYKSNIKEDNGSDASLEEYAKKMEEKALSSSEDTMGSFADEESYDFPDIYQSELLRPDGVDCAEFLDPVSFAKELVKNVVLESEAKVEIIHPPEKQVKQGQEDSSNMMQGFKESYEDFTFIETKRSFSNWPTIENFTVETGAYKIDEYLASFDTEEDWMYVIYYQGVQETHCSDLYKYQAIYSLPTWRYPIAQATASIYFTIELCKAKPQHCSVDVTFKYETYRQICKPGMLDFQEKWLQYILDSKIKFFQTVTY